MVIRPSRERQPLVLSFYELNQDEEDELPEFASPEDAFFGTSIFKFTADEVHGTLQTLFCAGLCECWGCQWVRSFCNPVYAVLFVVLYAVAFCGILLHRVLYCCIPVKMKESPEEREFRSQGIYITLGIALISIPFTAVGYLLTDDESMEYIDLLSLVANVVIVLISLIGLKAIGEELEYSIRIFSVGSWLLFCLLLGLILADIYLYLTSSWLTIIEYLLRVFQIFAYLVVSMQTIELWGKYSFRSNDQDGLWSVLLCLLFFVVFACFGIAIFEVSEEDAWRVLYW